ncbi:PAS domain-containing sensor histidine kinase [Vibrio sinaloensis]|uniref:PAS domain-containing sensor histidine kinase n=1 Tax=Photobacterium sp. (strain ATCC 43367) TaxID=379097 RepID=UPI002F3E731C
MSRGHRYWLVILVISAISAIQIASREIATQWSLSAIQSQTEQRLLDYIGDARRSLQRFYHLPYLVTNDSQSLDYLKGNLTLQPDIEEQLAKLDKAANTLGWSILSSSGDVLASSSKQYQLPPTDIESIVKQIHKQREGVAVVTKNKGTFAEYFLAAPMYLGLDIAGIVVVQIDLSLLTEQWLTSEEIILAEKPNSHVFLSSSKTYTADWFNDAFDKQQMSEPTTLFDDTRFSIWPLGKTRYLAQSVLLDDLQWELTYLTPISTMENNVAWLSWSIAAACVVVCLLLIIRYQKHQKALSQVRIQKLLVESEKRLNAMINKTHVGILLVNKDGLITDINSMAKRYFNLADSMIGSVDAWQLFDTGNPNSTTLRLLKNLSQHREVAELSSVETFARRSDGSHFPVLFSISQFRWDAHSYYLCTIMDISKRKKAEIALESANRLLQQRVEERSQALEEAQKELIETSKLAALGRMSSAITHELNQPLTGLRTLLSSNQLLIERGETKLAQANLELVNTLIDRMANMTSQLKSFAFQKLENPEPVSLTLALEEVLRLEQDALKSIDVRVRVAQDVNWVLGEEVRLRQVLGNLIRNAIDALKGCANPAISINAKRIGDKVTLDVSDNGCGIDPDQLGSIFEPFQTNKKIGEGLGLGLAITANNVRDMRGTIHASLNTESGMTFTLTLDSCTSGR